MKTRIEKALEKAMLLGFERHILEKGLPLEISDSQLFLFQRLLFTGMTLTIADSQTLSSPLAHN